MKDFRINSKSVFCVMPGPSHNRPRNMITVTELKNC